MTEVTGLRPTVLLERGAEVGALAESLREVRDTGRGRVVLVGAEAGGGKTALLRSFSTEHNGRVLWGACDPLFTPRPLGPLLAVGEAVGGELEDVVRTGALPHEVVSALGRELSARPGSVLVLDDLHWADEATLDVFKLMTRRAEPVPALVVATYRDIELDRHHPLRRVLGELATSDVVRRLKLAPLSREAVAELAEPYGADADDVYTKTAGNPFFVVEALAAGGDEVPETVRDAVLARAAPLSAPARSLLEAVAIVPQQAELWLLEAIAADALESLDECLASGMLTAEPAGVRFRHELARLAVEDSVPLGRRLALHRAALAALADPPGGVPELARLADHAERAGDTEAALRYAPAAGARAAELGAYREAAAQYARALRFGDRLTREERAELLERRTEACFVTDQYDEGIAAIGEAAELRRAAGDRLREGADLRTLSEFLWCPGRVPEAERAALEAVAVLESLPQSRELAMAYANLAHIAAASSRHDEAVVWGERALRLAVRFDDLQTAVYASGRIAVCQGDSDRLEDILDRAMSANLVNGVADTYALLAGSAVATRQHERAARHLDLGLAYCGGRGLELWLLYLLAFRGRLELNQGRWSEAAETAALVLRIPRTSTTPRIDALTILATVRARRGDPEIRPLLEEAWRLAEPTGELGRLAPVAAASAEAAWLTGDLDGVEQATSEVLALAELRGDSWVSGALALWRRRAGIDEDAPAIAAGSYALELAGDWREASLAWRALGCPYESALAVLGGDDDDALREALTQLQELGGQPAATFAARRLRELGAAVPRGPRPATRLNAAQLTTRELEVLTLIADGLRNTEIADRLVVSVRTVDHHVSAILRKLGVRSRGEAATAAIRQGLLAQER